MPTETQVSSDDPRMVAWNKYKESDAYANTRRWASKEEAVDGSLWASFIAGFEAALGSDSDTGKTDGI